MSGKKRFYPPTEDQQNAAAPGMHQQGQVQPGYGQPAPFSPNMAPHSTANPQFYSPNPGMNSPYTPQGGANITPSSSFSTPTYSGSGNVAQTNPPTHLPPPTSGDISQAQQHSTSGRRVYVDPEDHSSYDEQSAYQPTNGGAVNQLASGMQNLNVSGNQNANYYPPSTGVQPAAPSPQYVPGNEAGPVSIAANYQCPRLYMRMTMNAIPSSTNLLNKSNIPFGVIVHPMATPTTAEEQIPIVNFGASGILRCRRCRTYINPFVSFIEGGRRWRCNLCALPNDVPNDYFSPIDATGRRQDMDERPELSKGAVEFVAPSEYMVRPPQPPCYLFVIDVGYYSIQSGMFHTAIETIKRTLGDIPGSPRTRIGFITYDSTVQFYNLKSTLSTPQMLVVADIDDIFLPLPEDMLVNLNDSRNVIENLLSKFPTMFQSTQTVESAAGVALKAAFEVIKNIGGKIILLSSVLPTLGVGKLKKRDDPKLLGTDKESSLLLPEDNHYKSFALDCSRQQISVDVFLTAQDYTDVATLGCMPQFTGGQLYYYPGFKAAVDGERFYRDLIRDITRETAFEAVMRFRTSKGLKAQAHFGNFFIRSTDLLALPNCDADKAFAVQLALSESTVSANYFSFQAALLYTTSVGERRIRVFTQCLPITSNLTDVFKSADNDAITTLTTKMAIEKALTTSLRDTREALVLKCIEILSVYRTDLAPPGSNTGSLMLPETLKNFPLYILALIKNVLFRSGTDIRSDERAFYMMHARTLPINLTIPLLYGRLFALHNLPEGAGTPGASVLPPTLNLSSEKLERSGIYIVEDGQQMWMWIGRTVPQELLVDIFGIPSLDGVDTTQLLLPHLETEYSTRVNTIIAEIRNQRPSYLPLYIVREGDPMEFKFFNFLIEDKSKTVHSYYEFLVNLHQRIQAKVMKK